MKSGESYGGNLLSDSIAGIALKEEQDREAAKRNTLSHTPDRKPEADSPRQSRSPLKNDKKEKVRKGRDYWTRDRQVVNRWIKY